MEKKTMKLFFAVGIFCMVSIAACNNAAEKKETPAVPAKDKVVAAPPKKEESTRPLAGRLVLFYSFLLGLLI